MKLRIILATGISLICSHVNATTATPPQATNQMQIAAAAPSSQTNKTAETPAIAQLPAAPTATVQAPATVTTATTSAPGVPAQTTVTVQSTAPMTLTTPKAKISYTIGVDMGQNFKNQNIDVDADILAQGIKDALTNGKTLMTPQEMQDTLVSFQKDLIAKRETEFNTLKVKNKQEGDAFLAANRTKPGVVALPDGLQYKIIQDGKGVQPTEKDIVTVHYTGTFVNGKEFDSSYKRGKPVTTPLSDMIPGWVEALKLMKTGATWEIYVPPSLAYGERGAPPVVGPNQTLVFKVNLIDVKKSG